MTFLAQKPAAPTKEEAATSQHHGPVEGGIGAVARDEHNRVVTDQPALPMGTKPSHQVLDDHRVREPGSESRGC